MSSKPEPCSPATRGPRARRFRLDPCLPALVVGLVACSGPDASEPSGGALPTFDTTVSAEEAPSAPAEAVLGGPGEETPTGPAEGVAAAAEDMSDGASSEVESSESEPAESAPASSEGTPDLSTGELDSGDPAGGDAPGASAGGEDDSSSVPPVDPSQLGPITIWLAGDSTVANGNTPCPTGWGKVFAPYFDERVTIVNRAVGGRSVNTWLYDVLTTMDSSDECEHRLDGQGNPILQARWQGMLDDMKPGDYLLIQFGINDGDRTCDRHVGLDAFQESYGMMAQAAKERGAQPVFITPVSSIACRGNEPYGSRGGFVPATVEAGERFDVPVIDLHARSVELYAARDFCPVAGGDVSASTGGAVGDFFCDDHTHFDERGAVVIAGLVVDGIRAQQLQLSAYLR